jgi:hypothetical protein
MKNPYGILCLGFFVLLVIGTTGFARQQKEDKCLGSDCVSGWTPIDTPYGGRNIRALAMRSPNMIIAANDSGVYRTNFTSLYGPFSWLLLSKMKVTSVAISIDSITRDTVVYLWPEKSRRRIERDIVEFSPVLVARIRGAGTLYSAGFRGQSF